MKKVALTVAVLALGLAACESKTANAVENSNVGDAMENDAAAVGNAVENTATDTGNAIDNGLNATDNAAANTVNAADNAM